MRLRDWLIKRLRIQDLLIEIFAGKEEIVEHSNGKKYLIRVSESFSNTTGPRYEIIDQ
jgi:hypothetical protein